MPTPGAARSFRPRGGCGGARVAAKLLWAALIPIAMSNLGIDPAAAGVVVTAIADVMGFLVFLGLATMLLL
jgi:magnesium transporter